MRIEDVKDIIIKPNEENRAIALEGICASGKTTAAIERFNYLISSRNGKSSDIMVFVPNRSQSYLWRSSISYNMADGTNISSYFGFVQKELRKYWMTISNNSDFNIGQDIEPVFMNFEASQSVAAKIVSDIIESGGFAGINSTPERIAIKLTSALTRAVMGGVDYQEIGDRLAGSLDEESPIKKETFDDVNTVIKKYTDTLLENGVLDYGMAVYIYNRYLLCEPMYRAGLNERIKHLIVDNLEDVSPVEADLYKLLADGCDSVLYIYNREGGYEKYGSNKDYAEQVLLRDIKTIRIAENLLDNTKIVKFADILSKNILLETAVNYNELKYELDIKSQFRSDMIEKIISKIEELMDNGYRHSDIAVICPDNDLVLEYEIKKKVEAVYGKSVQGLGRKGKIIENIYSWSLITIAMLCYDYENIKPDRDDIRTMLSVVLGCDEVRADLAASKMYKKTRSTAILKRSNAVGPLILSRIGFDYIEKYEYLRKWIEKQKKEMLPIDELLRKIYIEVLLKIKGAKENIAACRNLIDSAENFRKSIMKIADVYHEGSYNSDFIKFIKAGTKAAESFFDIQEKFGGDYLMIATPVLYNQMGKNHKIHIWTDVNSDGWTPRNVNELENPYVLSRSWERGRLYDGEIEFRNKKVLMSTILKTVMKRCTERIYFYGSTYSMKGYEQESILYEGLVRTAKNRV